MLDQVALLAEASGDQAVSGRKMGAMIESSSGFNIPGKEWTMTMEPVDAHLVRELVASCDWKEALAVPKVLFGYVASVLDSREPSVYLIDLLPSLSASAQAFLTGIGAFSRSPLPDGEVARRRSKLLECLDAFIDEARLSQQSIVFMDALRAGERS
jgi:hypothetical protein